MAAAGLVYALGGNAAQAATAEGVAWATTPLQVYAAKRAYESYGNPSTPPRKRPKAQLDWNNTARCKDLYRFKSNFSREFLETSM